MNLLAEWTDPVDLPGEPGPGQRNFKAPVDELPVPCPSSEGYLAAPGAPPRRVGYYDPENDQIAMVRAGDRAGPAAAGELHFRDATPRHELGDTKRHIVRYTAVATSRYREYFDQDLDFTRSSEPMVVDVPASGRPLAPDIVYVVPTFGWQRQGDTNMKRSIRYGGGLRVWLNRPWFSSGTGELLGVALWNSANGPLDGANREKYKNVFTQWGMDPIWQTWPLHAAPEVRHFPDAVASDIHVSLEEASARVSASDPGRVDVVGFERAVRPPAQAVVRRSHDRASGWADLRAVRAAGAGALSAARPRRCPHLAGRTCTIRAVDAGPCGNRDGRPASSADAQDRGQRHCTQRAASGRTGTQPTGPANARPGTRAEEAAGRRRARMARCTPAEASVAQFYEGQALFQPNLGLWVGAVSFFIAPAPGAYRLLIEEFEYISANHADNRRAPGRLIYAEIIEVDAAMMSNA